MRAVVDGHVGAEIAHARELVVTARRHDRAQPEHLRELQPEHRDATGAEQQHCGSRPQPLSLHERVPGRQAGAGQGRGLLVGPAARGRDDAGRGQHDRLGQHAVDGTAEGRIVMPGLDAAIEPVLEEAPGDMVAHGHAAHAFAHGAHHPRAVGERDPVSRSARDEQVSEVQRGRAHQHDDLTGTRRRLGELADRQAVDARSGKDVCAHARTLASAVVPRGLN